LSNRRYILLHRSGSAPSADLGVIERTEEVRIVDRTLDRALLVEASESAMARLRSQLTGWVVEEEKVHPHPAER